MTPPAHEHMGGKSHLRSELAERAFRFGISTTAYNRPYNPKAELWEVVRPQAEPGDESVLVGDESLI